MRAFPVFPNNIQGLMIPCTSLDVSVLCVGGGGGQVHAIAKGSVCGGKFM
jgi:hypothetical protein